MEVTPAPPCPVGGHMRGSTCRHAQAAQGRRGGGGSNRTSVASQTQSLRYSTSQSADAFVGPETKRIAK